jgi:recombination protein RecT
MATTATRERTEQPAREAPAGNLPATTEPKRQHPIVEFQAYATERAEQLAFALPAHISPERFTRVLMTALQRKADLLKCTKQSLWNACMLAAQDGLLPDGREGAIVPYGENANGKKQADIATWMPMIEGLRKKARNSGEISDWSVQVVRARDEFDFALGDDAFIMHRPYFGIDDPGQVIGAYSIATLKDGTKSREVMSRRELDAIRAKSRATNGPWGDPTFFPEMCRKTVARRHYKQLPHSSDLDDMIARDDQAFGIDDRSSDQIEQRQQRRQLSTTAAFDQFAGSDADVMPTDAAGDTIDHDPETGEADPAPEQQVAAPAAAPRTETRRRETKPPAEKPAAAKPATEKPASPAKDEAPPMDDTPPADEQLGSDATGDPVDDIPDSDQVEDKSASFDAGIDHDARVWPAGQVPTDVDEYELYLDTMIASATDPRKLQNTFVGDGKLRGDCGVVTEQYTGFVTKVKTRMAELEKARK